MSENKTYNTRQREKILTFLDENKRALLTADEIVEKLKKEGSAVGKATVYRYLEHLEKEGVVRRYFLGDDKSASYQYIAGGACSKHYHLRCTACGEVIHLDCDFMERLCAHIFDEHGFAVDSAKTVFYGLCEKCAERKKNDA